MSVSKAYKQAMTPEFREYEEALLKYKKQCSVFQTLRFKISAATDPTMRLMWLETKEQFRQACKDFDEAKTKFKTAKIEQELTARGKLGQVIEFAKVLGIDTSARMEDLMKMQKQDAVANSFKPGEMEKLKVEFLALRSNAAPAAGETAEYEQNGQRVSVEDSNSGIDTHTHSVSDDPTKEF